MKHRLLLQLLVLVLGSSSVLVAQNARESSHIVQPGETLAVIASRYDVDLQDIAALNGIYNYSLIQSWQELAIPGESVTVSPVQVYATIHTVSYGETLGLIAARHGVDLVDLMSTNGLYSHVIFPGLELQIPRSNDSALVLHDVQTTVVADDQAVVLADDETLIVVDEQPAVAPDESPARAAGGRHIVQYGETLGTIAAAYGIDLYDLIVLNGIFGHIIYAGQELKLPGTDAGAEFVQTPDEAEAIPVEKPVIGSQSSYFVKPGDTLSEIASQYGVTLFSLMTANDILYPHRILVGQQLSLPSVRSINWTVSNIEADLVSRRTKAADESAALDTPTTAETSTVSSDAAETNAPEITVPPPGDYFEHTVRFGETLGTLAVHYGVTVQELVNANAIEDAHRIDNGQALWIPGTASRRDPPPAPQQPATISSSSAAGDTLTAGERDQYIVQPGDYLSLIGNKLGTSWVAMAEINAIVNPNSLYVGMTLLVPNSDDLLKYGSSYGNGRYALTSNHPGAHRGVGREFVVVLSTQMAYAYEDGVLQRAALVSTGLPATPTVQGNYAIYRKRRSQHMRGPDYDLPNVEWVSYFYQGYALHGTYWHNNFGRPMSHGCVNMTNADAKWFYDFGKIGTPVHVQYY